MSTTTGVVPLTGRTGIIGFVPKDAIDPRSDQIELVVSVTYEGTEAFNVRFTTSIADLQSHLSMDHSADSAAGLRQHILDKYVLPLVVGARPQLQQTPIDRVAMFWVSRDTDRLEPFLR